MSTRRWISRGLWAVLDQGLFAGANFVLNIVLARWLLEAEYGVFTVAYAIFLLMATVHTAVLTEPMLVFAAGRYREQTAAYLRVLGVGHWLCGALFAMAAAAVALVLWRVGQVNLAWPMFAVAAAGPTILTLWLCRRACYVIMMPHRAAMAGAVNLALMLGGMFALYYMAWLSAATALLLMGAAGLVVAVGLLRMLRMDRLPRGEGALVRQTLASHWIYGRWAVATGLLVWVPSYVYYLMLPVVHGSDGAGLEEGGELRAMANLIMPVMHGITSLLILLLPALSRAVATGGFGRLASRAAIALLTGAALYYLVLLALGRPIVGLIYGGAFQDGVSLLWVLGLLPLAAACSGVLGMMLRALERPDLTFWASLGATGVTVTLGLWLAIRFGAQGAAAGMVASQFAGAIIMAVLVWRCRERRAMAQPVVTCVL